MVTSGNYAPLDIDEFTPRPYGLLQSATAITPTGPHWQGGITWNPICASGTTTYMACITGATTDPPPAKAATFEDTHQGARPFTILTEFDCNPVGAWDDAESVSLVALTRAEQRQAEYTFWTGIAADQKLVYPNLTSPTLVDGEVILQPGGVFISGSVPLDITEGLGRLEAQLGVCWDGVGVIHVPSVLLTAMCAQGLVYERNGKLYTKAGNLVIAGAGYPATYGPNGVTSPAGTAWLMATGPVFKIVGPPRVFDKRSSLDRGVNTLKMISERTVLIGFHCCLAGVLVSTGGEPSGTPNA